MTRRGRDDPERWNDPVGLPLEVVELNPFLDHANVSAERAVTLIQSALGRSIL